MEIQDVNCWRAQGAGAGKSHRDFQEECLKW